MILNICNSKWSSYTRPLRINLCHINKWWRRRRSCIFCSRPHPWVLDPLATPGWYKMSHSSTNNIIQGKMHQLSQHYWYYQPLTVHTCLIHYKGFHWSTPSTATLGLVSHLPSNLRACYLGWGSGWVSRQICFAPLSTAFATCHRPNNHVHNARRKGQLGAIPGKPGSGTTESSSDIESRLQARNLLSEIPSASGSNQEGHCIVLSKMEGIFITLLSVRATCLK